MLVRAAVFAVLASLLLACGPGQAGPVATSSGGTAGAGGEPGSTGPGGAGGAGGSGGAGGAPPTAEASILTWNLEFFPHGAGAVEQAAAIVLDLDPDLIAVQEIAEPAAFDDLLSALPEYDGILNDDPGAYLRVGLVYRRDRVSLSEVETLFSDDGYAFPRPPLKARVSLDGSIDFVALVVHLKAQLDTESEARRRAACYALDEWVRAERANGEEQDYLLLGDFNDKLTDPPSWNVFGAFLDRPEVYSFLTMPLAQAGEHSYIPFESMIDHVLVTNDLLDEVGAGTTEVLPLEQSVPDYLDLTDHRPVRTWLEP